MTSEFATKTASTSSRGPWLHSPVADLGVFGGSALASIVVLACGRWLGIDNGDSPEWAWIAGVLLVDVAHVYATAFKTYFVPGELARRPWLYSLAPALTFAVGWALYSESALLFWRTLAYLAVFHFVRQQMGWVSLYRARAGETDRLGRFIDLTAVALATIYPLAYWHAHLPRRFWWFLPDDFAPAPAWLDDVVLPFYVAALSAYTVRSLTSGIVHGRWNIGKDVVVATTSLCWHLGIVAWNSDFAFTVTNVLIHGVPYMAFVYWTRDVEPRSRIDASTRVRRAFLFLATLWALAFSEELLWDRGLWHERGWLFGWLLPEWTFEDQPAWLAPLLATPQAVHYVLDGFIWRRRSNARFAAWVAPTASASTP